jgi:uncharacterized protein
MENFNSNTPPQYPALEEQTELKPVGVLATAFALFVAGNIIATVLMLGIAHFMGYNLNDILQNLSENAPVGDRNLTRAILFLNHLFAFILPAILTAIIAYKRLSTKYLRLDRAPNWTVLLASLMWLVASTPVVQYAYKLGKMLPLPQWMRGLEQDTSRMLEGIIMKDHWYEAVVNVILIGVIPGLGEEMMFRGVIQQQFGRFLKNEHVQVWLAAAFFSAIHLQFEGFWARMILGALLGYMLVWSRNLWIPIIVHALNNGLQVIAIYVMNIKPSEMDKIGNGDDIPVWGAILSLVFVVGIGFSLKKMTEGQQMTQELP